MDFKYLFRKILVVAIILYTSAVYSQRFDITEDENIEHQRSFMNYEIFKNIKKNTFFITDRDEKILVRNLKYCELLSYDSYLQIITERDEMAYLDTNLKIVKKTPGPIFSTVCGSVDSYSFEILKEGNYYLVQKTTNQFWTGGENEIEIINMIADQNFDNLYFINREQKLYFDNNYSLPEYVIFEKDSKYGIADKGNIFMFDSISIVKGIYSKIEKSGLFNYYHISPNPKYKRLDGFVYNLAYFELPNGKSGYVDLKGHEYYK